MSKGYKAYISCPVSVSAGLLLKIVDRARTEVDEVKFWDRNSSYNDNWVREADVFILVLPNNKFKYNINNLPNGCRVELNRARCMGKPVYLAYQSMHGIRMYNTEIYLSSNIIEGIPGTSHRLANDNQLFADKQSEKMNEEAYFDIETRPLSYTSYRKPITSKDFSDLYRKHYELGFMFANKPEIESEPDRRLLFRRK